MTAMFQEDYSKLRQKITQLQEQLASEESNSKRLSDLLSSERQKLSDAHRDLAEGQLERESLNVSLGRAQAATEHLASMETKLRVAESDFRDAQSEVSGLRLKNIKLGEELKETKSGLSTVIAELRQANDQIDPLRELVQALGERERANTTISRLLAVLDLDRPD